jgi:2-oxoglutarate ferredoxin oxidoreductase subunit alpha
MGEIPLVVVNVQRGGPSTGLPTKTEQGDLMTAIFGSHGDAPKVVMAPATIEDCFYSIITARRIAETFNTVVIVLSDATLATSQQPFPRPVFDNAWLAPPVDQRPAAADARPYDWNDTTGLKRRIVPGQAGGMHTLTGLAHDRDSHVAYDAEVNEQALRARSLKLAALQTTLKPPAVFGDRAGELLIVGWGSTKGAIEEAVASLRSEGCRVSSMHLQFLQPLPPGIKEILKGFDTVLTVEGNWSDSVDEPIIDESNRRYSALATLLRARYLVDVDCVSEVRGQPIRPGTIRTAVRRKLRSRQEKVAP